MKTCLGRSVDPVVRRFEFELAYLALLTKEGLKPLSRWEKPVDGSVREALGKLGLKTRLVERSTQMGRPVLELLLAASIAPLDAYAAHFAGAPLSAEKDTVRLEGRFFGYPPCCVESFVTRGYARNALRRRDQRILFHWACPGCAATPRLLPDYRRVYRACIIARGGPAWRPLFGRPVRFHVPRLRPDWAFAFSLAALGLLPAAGVPEIVDPPDPHVTAFSLSDDPDSDYLTSGEELILGLDSKVGDQDGNSVADGVDLARRLARAIDALPVQPSASDPFVTHDEVFGSENCGVCGAAVNMGFLEVSHSLENQKIQIPYVAKHFLDHGSFSFSGSVHSGRISPPLLRFILSTDGQGHMVSEPAGADLDGDGLRDWEEPAFGADPQKPDGDGDGLLDGIELARELRRALESLPAVLRVEDGPPDQPFVVKQLMKGLETCLRCGEVQTMGLWEVVNPVTRDSMTIPTMGIHYLAHGAFGWSGGQLLGGEGRVDPRHLWGVLTAQPNRHLLSAAPDRDGDGLTDLEEAAMANDAADPDENGNAIKDGLDLARVVACEIAGLPRAPLPHRVYRLDSLQRGLEHCDVCGASVNMGFLTICNPEAQVSIELPYVALHYLEHDSFSFAGDVHGPGRPAVKALLDTLFSPGLRIAVDENEASLSWSTTTGRTYRLFAAADPAGPWTEISFWEGDGTEKVFSEGKPLDRVKRFYKIEAR